MAERPKAMLCKSIQPSVRIRLSPPHLNSGDNMDCQCQKCTYVSSSKPFQKERCQSCRHEFAKHYTTYDGQTMGCHERYHTGYQMDPIITPCHCIGYAQKMRLDINGNPIQ